MATPIVDGSLAPQGVITTNVIPDTIDGIPDEVWKLVIRWIAQGDQAQRGLISFGLVSQRFCSLCYANLLVSTISSCHLEQEDTSSAELERLEPHTLLTIDEKGRRYSVSNYGDKLSRSYDILHIFDQNSLEAICVINLKGSDSNHKVDALYPLDDGFALASSEGCSIWKFNDPFSCEPTFQQFFPYAKQEGCLRDPLGFIDAHFFYSEDGKIHALSTTTGTVSLVESGELKPSGGRTFLEIIGGKHYALHNNKAFRIHIHENTIEIGQSTQFFLGSRAIWRPIQFKGWMVDAISKNQLVEIRIRKGLDQWLSGMEIIKPDASQGESLFFVDDFLFLCYKGGQIRIIDLVSRTEIQELSEKIQNLLNKGLKNKSWILHGLGKRENRIEFYIQKEYIGTTKTFSLQFLFVDFTQSSSDADDGILPEDFIIEPEEPIITECDSEPALEEEESSSSSTEIDSNIVFATELAPIVSEVLVESESIEEESSTDTEVLYVATTRTPTTHYLLPSQTEDLIFEPVLIPPLAEQESDESSTELAIQVEDVPAPVLAEKRTVEVITAPQSEGCTLHKVMLVAGGIFLLLTLAASIALLVLHPGRIIFAGHGIILTLPTVITLASGGSVSIILIAIGSCTWWLNKKKS